MNAFNQAIVDSAYAVLRGKLLPPKTSGMCLSLVRIVVEHALYKGAYVWYERYQTRPIERIDGAPTPKQSPWARDMERSLKAAGMALDVESTGGRYLVVAGNKHVQPGDLLFRWDAAPTKQARDDPKFIGHVGIMLHGEMVLENIDPDLRVSSFKRGVTAMTPIQNFPVTAVIRFDPRRPAAPQL